MMANEDKQQYSMNNKAIIIISIAIILILTAGVGAYFVSQRPASIEPLMLPEQSSKLTQSKCGDGICGPIEKKNPNLCPKDCEKSENLIDDSRSQSKNTDNSANQVNNKISPQDSPFSLQAPFNNNKLSTEEAVSLLTEVGIKFVRLLSAELPESVNVLAKNNIEILAGIAPASYPTNMDTHKNEVRSTVKLYKNNIKTWLVVNEADLMWRDTPEKYAEYFIATAQTVKSEDPDAVIMLGLAGGEKGLEFLDTALANGVGQYFDILDIHTQGDASNYKILDELIADYSAVFRKYGISEKPIWMTEFGTYDGDPDDRGKTESAYQGETVQASGLIKKYAYGLSVGVEKMFWTTMTEWNHYNGSSGDYFSNVGLINHAGNDGQSHKKLAYYSYKKMTEVLDGSDWSNIQKIQESDGIYIYKFIKNGKHIWVAWDDNYEKIRCIKAPCGRQITIMEINSTQVKITEAVPKFETGKDVTDYNTAFNTETKTASNGQISLTLGDKPVFVEEN